MKLIEVKDTWAFIENIGSISYWLERPNDGSGNTIGPEEVLEIGCQLEAEIDTLKAALSVAMNENQRLTKLLEEADDAH